MKKKSPVVASGRCVLIAAARVLAGVSSVAARVLAALARCVLVASPLLPSTSLPFTTCTPSSSSTGVI
jgi:hypothetical protein